MAILAEEVRAQIASGALRGYLAYADGLCIGWCNANDRANLPADSVIGDHLHAPAERRERAVLCFEIATTHRGQGVATALLERVLSADAAAEAAPRWWPSSRPTRPGKNGTTLAPSGSTRRPDLFGPTGRTAAWSCAGAG